MCNLTRFGIKRPDHNGSQRPFLEVISEADIIVNGSFQDPEKPYMFVTNEEISSLKPHSLIIDISCDEGMGFPFANQQVFLSIYLK
ncbi:MAG: hypothetical protein HON90_17795 [Halobacteriovoraceae bacterium]|nr:hypothetical protein [Halobacteriovoraceae bacterium]